MISEQSLNEVRERTSLSELVSEVVPLRRQGASLVGLCPFHAEKSPSFHIRGDDKHYHCFGCGASGGVFNFVMEQRGLSFREAVEYLAERVGVSLVFEGGRAQRPESRDEKTAILRVNKLAARYFQRELNRAPDAVRRYLDERGIQEQSLHEFGIGYAPPESGGLRDYLRQQGEQDAPAIVSGVLRRSPKGDVYDAFRGRLIFPIMVEGNRIAGFGGRLIPEVVDERTRQQAPKYINSPESPVYQKQKILYGLAHALPNIRAVAEAIIVEGYLDVIGLWQVGIRHVVAPCGTALTTEQVRRLQRITSRVTVLFDGDTAGRSAAAKSFSTFLNSGVESVARFLPEGEDPDSVALKNQERTAEVLRQAPAHSLWECFVHHAIQRYGGSSGAALSAALKGRVAQDCAQELRAVQNPVERHALIETAAMILAVPSEELVRLVGASVTVGASGRMRSENSATVGGSSGGAGEPSAHGSTDGGGSTPGRQLPALERELLVAVMTLKEEVLTEVLADTRITAVLSEGSLAFLSSFAEVLSRAPSKDARKDATKRLLQDLGPEWVALWRYAYSLIADAGCDMGAHYRQCRKALHRRYDANLLDALDEQLRSVRGDEEAELQLHQRKLELQRRHGAAVSERA